MSQAEAAGNVTAATPAGSSRVSGRAVAICAFLILLIIALFTYYTVPLFVNPYFRERPGQTGKALDIVEKVINDYRAAHGSFPPEEELNHYRRRNKNMLKSRSYGITSYSLAALTTPVAYFNPELASDPYAMPEQFCPFGYMHGKLLDGTEFAIIFSAGPNLVYDVRPVEFRTLSDEAALKAKLATVTHHPERGTRAPGDFVRLIVAR